MAPRQLALKIAKILLSLVAHFTWSESDTPDSSNTTLGHKKCMYLYMSQLVLR